MFRSKESFIENNSSYLLSVHDAQALLHGKESVDDNTRRDMILDVVNSITETRKDDALGVRDIVNKMRRLLMTDPLTDQQAGTLTRWMWEAGYWGQGSFEEALELRVSNWKSIEAICTSTPDRKAAWEKANQENLVGDNLITVYRGMRGLSASQIQLIYQFGILPAGLYRYGTFHNTLMHSRFRPHFYGSAYFKTEKAKKALIVEGPLSKSGLLRQHWFVDPDAGLLCGVDTPESLAISTTLKDSADIARRFGPHIIEMQIPANRLIARWDEEGMIDYTVLYYIEPSAIKGVYESKNPYKPVLPQLRNPLKRKPL